LRLMVGTQGKLHIVPWGREGWGEKGGGTLSCSPLTPLECSLQSASRGEPEHPRLFRENTLIRPSGTFSLKERRTSEHPRPFRERVGELRRTGVRVAS
jgi:hypothetical protein